MAKNTKGTALACFECGGFLSFKDKFCPNCGDSTAEELHAYSKS